MPIEKTEFEKGKLHSNLEEEIIEFLNQRKKRAFTSKEIMEGLNYHAEFSTPEITKISTFTISDFTSLLYDLVKREKIKMRVVRSRMYFIIEGERTAVCPKCGFKVLKPRKTWKMAGRPDRNGERMQLHIGLYDCVRHGAFRVVLEKKKIPAIGFVKKAAKKKKKKRTVKKRVVKKRTRKRKTTKKVRKKKRDKALKLI